ncbi:hypothetical protein PG991_012992 [Apiospora marii]|uniref:DUF6594 domain-containing protein n=1 Tax=Apiospora marii TaxID=335849 RepID=A0ABR1RBE2_9PEZI
MVNLLRLQAELVALEQQLDVAWTEDRTASTDSEDNNRDAEDRRLGRILDMYDKVFGGRRETIDDHVRAYSPQTISRVGSAAVAALSSTLPTLAILALYFVRDMVTRMGLVILFTTIFSIALAIFTDAKKIEIFSATAAFAAVEVVYIGSTSTASDGGSGA